MNIKKIVASLLLLSCGISYTQNNNKKNNNGVPQPPTPPAQMTEEMETAPEMATDMTATTTAQPEMEAEVVEESAEQPVMEATEPTDQETKATEELSLMPTTGQGEQKAELTHDERELLMQKINEILSRLMALENLIVQQSEAEKVSPIETEAAEDEAAPMDTQSSEQALEEEEDQPDAPDML